MPDLREPKVIEIQNTGLRKIRIYDHGLYNTDGFIDIEPGEIVSIPKNTFLRACGNPYINRVRDDAPTPEPIPESENEDANDLESEDDEEDDDEEEDDEDDAEEEEDDAEPEPEPEPKPRGRPKKR